MNRTGSDRDTEPEGVPRARYLHWEPRKQQASLGGCGWAHPAKAAPERVKGGLVQIPTLPLTCCATPGTLLTALSLRLPICREVGVLVCRC